jgi:hypothetical protein
VFARSRTIDPSSAVGTLWTRTYRQISAQKALSRPSGGLVSDGGIGVVIARSRVRTYQWAARGPEAQLPEAAPPPALSALRMRRALCKIDSGPCSWKAADQSLRPHGKKTYNNGRQQIIHHGVTRCTCTTTGSGGIDADIELPSQHGRRQTCQTDRPGLGAQ